MTVTEPPVPGTAPPGTETAAEHPWAASSSEVLEAFDSADSGLTTDQVQKRIQRHGRNELPQAKSEPAWRRFLRQFQDVLIYILLAAALLKAVSSDWVDFTVIMVVILATGLIGYVQEGRAASALASLRDMQSLEAQVKRDGEWEHVDAAEVVPGDLVRLGPGARIPADLRIIAANNVKADESALTGESEATDKDERSVSVEAQLGDRSGMLFSGTLITTGTATGVVVATGGHTEIGKISQLVADQESMDTPLNRQLDRLGKQVSLIILVLAAAMLLIGRFVHNWPGDELVSAAIGFAVAAVPEGLPALVTITLALGVQQMARRQAITRRMESVETLGSVTVICSDKTGTLTQNEMTAREAVTRDSSFTVEGTGYGPQGRVVSPEGRVVELNNDRSFDALILAAAACNDAEVRPGEDSWELVGQPTEGALTVLATKAWDPQQQQEQSQRPYDIERLHQVPFDSLYKYSATLDRITPHGKEPEAESHLMIHVVGAPDRLLDRSDSEMTTDGALKSLDRSYWTAQLEELSAQGLRVLAAARRPAESDAGLERSDLDTGLTFLGLVGIVDPPRPEVEAAIRKSKDAGIRVAMITGDHPGTATAIARELGILQPGEAANALTGAQLEAMTQDELCQAVQHVSVYARTSPEHKLRIVRALQSQGQVVAMTGDGVNDAPSITRADVGVAMGIKGTEATKEAADIVLADDNFTTIEHAVEEGRRIYDNIRKSVVFLLPSNGAQSLVIIVAVLLGWTLPLSPVQILWVNLVTAITLSLALANEPAEPGIMNRRPRATDEHVLSASSLVLVAVASLVIGGGAMYGYLVQLELTGSSEIASTTAVLTLALGQLAYLFNCRLLNTHAFTSRAWTGNRTVWISTATLVGLQLIYTYVPFMHVWFGSASLGIRQWGTAIVVAVLIFLIMEATKAAVRRSTSQRDT
ncbi:cation-translocating P-type ATPase [Kocuria sp.]|uniref:cation-translocating P-type ATPase n=1 Tax=Kocuria sp. TaxID=1871328 RepID=UPI0026DFF32B|nr:HAD-IC family P-type ATPase [Kocuria sp.]MDO5617640.1 HAD-IC family P-type ATPase [Kocuria sp.]